MIPNNDQLNSIIGSKPLTSGGSADRDPNAFILTGQVNSAIAWFPLLPVTAPLSSGRKPNDKIVCFLYLYKILVSIVKIISNSITVFY